MKTVCMKYQILFSPKNQKKYFKMLYAGIFPSMQSINVISPCKDNNDNEGSDQTVFGMIVIKPCFHDTTHLLLNCNEKYLMQHLTGCEFYTFVSSR